MTPLQLRYSDLNSQAPATLDLDFAILKRRIDLILGQHTPETFAALVDSYNLLVQTPFSREAAMTRLDDPRYALHDDPYTEMPVVAAPSLVETLRFICEKCDWRSVLGDREFSWADLYALLALSEYQQACYLDALPEDSKGIFPLPKESRAVYFRDHLHRAAEAIAAAEAQRTQELLNKSARQQLASAGGKGRHKHAKAAIDAFINYCQLNPIKSVRNAAQKFIAATPIDSPLFKDLSEDNLERLLTDGYRREMKLRKGGAGSL